MRLKKEQLEILKEIMKLEFANVETTLYLDTHQHDARMLALHNKYACELAMLKRQYEQMYTPITHEAMSRCPWQYIKGPWPWEIEY